MMTNTNKSPGRLIKLRSTGQRPHRGVVLVLVMVVIAALSVTVYAYSRLMLTEAATIGARQENIQQGLLADSAIEQLLDQDTHRLALMSLPAETSGSLGSDFQSSILVLRTPNSTAVPSGMAAVVQQIPRGDGKQLWGLVNESGKLNLNSLSPDRYSRREVVEKLTCYPNLNSSIAQRIADLLGVTESDTISRESLERSERRDQPRILSFDQLLTVPGITESLLYGEDTNGNGILDPHEDDGDVSDPADNADGVLQTGWIAHWTLNGAESNFQPNGTRKINLNQPDLVGMYDQLVRVMPKEEARFLLAWRSGSVDYLDEQTESSKPTTQQILEERKRTIRDRVRAQLGLGSADGLAIGVSSEGSVRAGIDVRRSGRRKLRSLLDMANCQVQLILDGEDSVLTSPFASDPQSLRRWLTRWEQLTTVDDLPSRVGRINLMQASPETLETVDGISAQLAKQIVSRRGEVGRRILQNPSSIETIGWLLESGLVSTSELRGMADELTMGGALFRGVSIGQLDRSRTAYAIEFLVDGLGPYPRLRHLCDMPPLAFRYRIDSK